MQAIEEEQSKVKNRMLNIKESLTSIFELAIGNAFPGLKNAPVVLALAQNPKFGDYQCNSAMAISKVIMIRWNLKEKKTSNVMSKICHIANVKVAPFVVKKVVSFHFY